MTASEDLQNDVDLQDPTADELDWLDDRGPNDVFGDFGTAPVEGGEKLSPEFSDEDWQTSDD